MMNFHGKTIVITGAAGSFGRVLVDAFYQAGGNVLAVDINENRMRDIPRSGRLRPLVADISTQSGADSVAEAISGSVDVLVNNAAVGDQLALVNELSDAAWDRTISVNLGGSFKLCRRIIPVMLADGGGSILNIASVAGLRGGRGGAAYTASKWGLVGLTQNIAATLGYRGIRCNAICPGNTEGGMREKPSSPSQAALRILSRDREKPAPGDWSDVVQLALFLASNEASRINGTVIPVDAGWIAY
jgi:NAD(P)-dependent dehydrogenase (short-subunit alcohol dehydrogenase family)